ncbi:glycosyltransferase family 4 protein [Claveliimonas bilis]|uniref:glycosyltransferase family 4 protein n=1 Tax=Claveliimonas bilis TaxID=3028070 RepID=UPI00292DFF6F|nr:glycosyltransferase family 4 protein [Claveliimonas bilis]BDZ81827.1 hypothetical protein Lac3_30360 [Claveliimonas bilis]
MNILAITFEAPSKKSGGGIGVIQSIESLLECGDVDYIGPKFDDDILFKLHDVKNLYYSSGLKSRFNSAIHGVTNGYYESWLRIKDIIDWKKYDVVSVEFTRFYFVVKEAKKNNLPVIVRMHNVERDYFHNLYNIKRNLTSKIQEIVYGYNERKCVEKSDAILVLTNADSARILELYGFSSSHKIIVNPVCIPDGNDESNGEKRGFLITGSLWYGPNADGVLWVLKEVWPFFDKLNIPLVIAGSNPNPEIIKASKLFKNVCIVESPSDMSVYFLRAKYFIAPIFSGAGMKVKIAEAMMYGLPIVASEHALIGYEVNEATKCFKEAGELICSMKELLAINDEGYIALQKMQRAHYFDNYSMKTSTQNYKNTFSKIIT